MVALNDVTRFFNMIAGMQHAQQILMKNYPTDATFPIEGGLAFEKLALLSTEVSETIVAYKKPSESEHLPGLSSEVEELADIVLRTLDYAAARKLDIGSAITRKMVYNATRGAGYGNR